MGWTAEPPVRESQREEEPTSKKKKRERRGHGAGSRMSSDDDDGSDDATTFGKEDTQVRQLAKRKPGALGVPMMVQMVRQTGETGDSWGTEELEAALRSRVLAGSFFSRVLLSNGRLSMGAQLELKTLAEVMDGIASGRLAATFDLVVQRFHAVEAANTEEGVWFLARHLDVLPSQRSTTTTSDMWTATVQGGKKILRSR